MRHRKRSSDLNRFTSWRKATVKSLLRSLILHQTIRTTKAKAKLAQPYVDRIIGRAKQGDLIARRYAFDMIGDHRLVQRLFNTVVPLFSKRNSGYTRIISLGSRLGDGADTVLFELTEKKKTEHIKKEKPVKEKPSERPKEEIKRPQEEAPKPHIKDIIERKEEKPSEKKPEKEVKPKRKFLGGIRNIFKKERDSL